ncbi:hypothetical protein V8F33_014038 [Rhypophila sp. PSN 637]
MYSVVKPGSPARSLLRCLEISGELSSPRSWARCRGSSPTPRPQPRIHFFDCSLLHPLRQFRKLLWQSTFCIAQQTVVSARFDLSQSPFGPVTVVHPLGTPPFPRLVEMDKKDDDAPRRAIREAQKSPVPAIHPHSSRNAIRASWMKALDKLDRARILARGRFLGRTRMRSSTPKMESALPVAKRVASPVSKILPSVPDELPGSSVFKPIRSSTSNPWVIDDDDDNDDSQGSNTVQAPSNQNVSNSGDGQEKETLVPPVINQVDHENDWKNETRPNIMRLSKQDPTSAIGTANMAFAEPDIVNGELRGGLGVVWRTQFARGHDLTQVYTAIPGLYGRKSACVKEMYSINQGELTAIDISLEQVERLIEQYGSGQSQFRATIFTDSAQALPRLRDGIHAVPARGKYSFYIGHTLPVVRSCISRSYKLREKGCEINLCWIPRRSTPGAKLADKLAGRWFEQPEVYWNHCMRGIGG